MRQGDSPVVDLQFNYPQWQAHQAIGERRTIFYGWGRGVGKSWFTRCAWWLLVAQYENKLRTNALKPFSGVRITVMMPHLTQFKDVHLAGMENELGPGGDFAFLNGKIDRQRGHVSFPGGSWLKAFPATAHTSKGALGMRTDVLSCDEVDDIDAEVYQAFAVPFLSEPWSLGIELLAGTPRRGRHGLWWNTLQAGRKGELIRSGAETPELDEEERRALASIYAFHATYEDAPETVSAQAVAKAKATTPAATFNREWRSDPDAGEGLVYPFDERIHVAEPPPLNSFREFHVGMDHGWVDAGFLGLAGIQGHGEDAVVWLLDEWYESECPNHVWNERAQAWNYAKFWPDPSRPDRINDLRAMGLKVGETDNNLLGGIARVAELMFVRTTESGERYSRFYVSPKCKHTIREFGLYRRKKLPDGTFDEMPEDKNNHSMDGVRYLVVGRFGRAPNYRTVTSGR